MRLLTTRTRTKKKKTPFAKNTSGPLIDFRLLNLVSLRIAQLHGCAYCVEEKTRKLGVKDPRLQELANWRNNFLFSDREEAALNLAETLTRHPISTAMKDALYAASFFFDEDEIVGLILRIFEENDWHYLLGACAGKKLRRPPHE